MWNAAARLYPKTKTTPPPFLFEGNFDQHLGAGAFEVITPRRLPFDRVAAVMSKAIFDMGFVIGADVRPPLPTVSAEDL
jgi:hypothetical protein